MKNGTAIPLFAAVTAVALLAPAAMRAQTAPNPDSLNAPGDRMQPRQTPSTDPSQAAESAGAPVEARDMVPARVAVAARLDATKARAGDQIKTRLSNTVALKNGIQLPAGTEILGVVAEDDMKTAGRSKLALNFNQAKLKDGTVVPIKATILGLYPPENEDISGRPITPGDQMQSAFTGSQDGVDQLEALPGVNLHSKVESSVSGVLESSKHDVKIAWGSEIALAIAPSSPGSPASMNRP